MEASLNVTVGGQMTKARSQKEAWILSVKTRKRNEMQPSIHPLLYLNLSNATNQHCVCVSERESKRKRE